ncbi:CbtB domain-containing protein [Solwaraspora sp. WMMA2101]|uniref:CbtB domain-containing protein n=1 Tax=Solwaraspora sp. WMMA2101 TaxID=3404124 RepID=UPI003B956001
MTAPSVGGEATTPAIRVPLAGWLLAAVAAVVIYLVAQDNGLVLAGAAEFVHEFTHDGRHALGVPCH